jgi:hypothetical protein
MFSNVCVNVLKNGTLPWAKPPLYDKRDDALNLAAQPMASLMRVWMSLKDGTLPWAKTPLYDKRDDALNLAAQPTAEVGPAMAFTFGKVF